MGWKDWPYWLKGGVISSLISIIIIFLYFRGAPWSATLTGISFLVLLFPLILTFILLNPECNRVTCYTGPGGGQCIRQAYCESLGSGQFSSHLIVPVIIALGIYLLIGIFLGWLYGKMKKPRN
ncbi:hypothetical protein KW805_02710 [Candidatus Pacearchaeota archaeon]|nr:hypothetical protein [Candidatus Pacearchaeota archaeon]